MARNSHSTGTRYPAHRRLVPAYRYQFSSTEYRYFGVPPTTLWSQLDGLTPWQWGGAVERQITTD